MPSRAGRGRSPFPATPSQPSNYRRRRRSPSRAPALDLDTPPTPPGEFLRQWQPRPIRLASSFGPLCPSLLHAVVPCRNAPDSMDQTLKQQEPAIRLEDVHVTLVSRAGPVAILRGLDMTVAAGQSIAVVGRSGSGKSTLLMIIAGLERATEGRVSVLGADFSTLNEDDLARLRAANIGIVFQSFHLVPPMTAIENVALPLEFLDRDDAFDAARASLAEVGLSHRETHFPGQLSGGEPTGNLDETTGADVMDLLFTLKERTQATLMLITHDRALAKRCDRIVSLADGRVTCGGAKRRAAAS